MNHYIISKVNILLCSYEEISNITKTLSENQRTEVSILPSIIKYKKKEQLPDDEILETKVNYFYLPYTYLILSNL